MSYGTIKVNTVTFTNDGVDKSVTLSGLVQNPIFSGNVTVTGTLSGVTVTGTTANFTSGNFTNISGGTHTIASGVFAAGSAASPSITFTGDLNTGIYSPGADQVAISTSGSGQVFVSSNGNLGIGTLNVTNIAGKIHSRADGNEAKALLVLQNRDTGASAGSAINFVNGSVDLSDDRYSYIRSIVTGAGQNGNHLVFGTNANGAAPQERLRITSAGNVGIGTTSPAQPLDVMAIAANSRVLIGDSGISNVPVIKAVNSTNTASRNLGYDAAQHRFYLYGTQVFTIGTDFVFNTGGSERARITSAGLVGIGTTSPNGFLHIETPATTSGWQLRLDSVGLNNESGFFRTASDNYEMVLRNAAGGLSYLTNAGGASTSTLEFIVQGSERARIDSSGRLLVGTSSDLSGGGANTSFQLAASSGSGVSTIAQIYSFNSGGGVAALDLCRSKSTTLGTNTTVANNDYIGSLNFKGANGSSYLAAASVSCEIDGAVSGGGAADMPGRLVFSVTADGASSPTEAMRIKNSRILNFANTPTYADNTAAKAGGLVDGDVYRKSDGTLMIVYT